MSRLKWDQVGERRIENGVDHGVLYKHDNGQYDEATPWNGLTTVTETPSGAESNPQYADNIVYVNMISNEQFAATIEALTYPQEFEECDGYYSPAPGVVIGQQNRVVFGLSYRSRVVTDTQSLAGHKVHLVYGCLAAPSEKTRSTVNDSPEAMPFSWELSTTPVDVGVVDGLERMPTSIISIDQTRVPADKWTELCDKLYGTEGADGYLPLPGEIVALFTGSVVVASTAAPTYNSATDTITIPTTTGVEYLVDGEVVAAGPLVITEDTVVTARPTTGYVLSDNSDNDWFFDYTP